jgi:hypothetical protein
VEWRRLVTSIARELSGNPITVRKRRAGERERHADSLVSKLHAGAAAIPLIDAIMRAQQGALIAHTGFGQMTQ